MTAKAIIEIEGLSKSYGNLAALSSLNLTIHEGDTFGFIGPNGAGKTTTMRILSTLLLPTTGKATVCGVDVCRYPEEVRKLIGYMPDYFGTYDDLRVWEYLDFFAHAYNVKKSRRPSMIDGVLELTDLTAKKDALVDSLSRGMKQRLCLAKTLVHDPAVLLLDEPASGLDPRARIEIRELLKELGGMGKTIFISSHILSELSELCNKICIIEQGKLIAQGAVDTLADKVKPPNLLRIECLCSCDKAQEILKKFPALEIYQCEDKVVLLSIDGAEEEIPPLIARLIEAGLPIVGFGREERDLEQIFMKMTEGVVA